MLGSWESTQIVAELCDNRHNGFQTHILRQAFESPPSCVILEGVGKRGTSTDDRHETRNEGPPGTERKGLAAAYPGRFSSCLAQTRHLITKDTRPAGCEVWLLRQLQRHCRLDRQSLSTNRLWSTKDIYTS